MSFDFDFGPSLCEDELWRGFGSSSVIEGAGSASGTSSEVEGTVCERGELPAYWLNVERQEIEKGEVHEKGCSLEVVLRRLTSLYACSSFDVWSFLLQLRTFMNPRALMQFLVWRYISAPTEHTHRRDGGEADAQSEAQPHVNTEADVEAKAEMRHDDETHAGLAMRLSVAMVLEIWLASFPEDFLPDSLEGIHLRNPAVDVVVGTGDAMADGGLVSDDEGDVMDVLCRFLLFLEEDGVVSGEDGMSRVVSPTLPHDNHYAHVDVPLATMRTQSPLRSPSPPRSPSQSGSRLPSQSPSQSPSRSGSRSESYGVFREARGLILAIKRFANVKDELEEGTEHAEQGHGEMRVSFCVEEEGNGNAADMRLPAIVEASMAARRCIVPRAAAIGDEASFGTGLEEEEVSAVATAATQIFLCADAKANLGPDSDKDHASETIRRLGRPCGRFLRKMLMMQLGDVMVRALRPVMEQYSTLAATLAVTELQSLASNIDDMVQRSVLGGRVDSNVRLFNSAVDKMFISLPKTDLGHSSSVSVFDTEEDDGGAHVSGGIAMNAKGESFQDRLSMAFEVTRQSETSTKKTRRRLSGRLSVGGGGSIPSSAPSSAPGSTVTSPAGAAPTALGETNIMSTSGQMNPFEMDHVKQKWRPGFFMRKLGRRLSGRGGGGRGSSQQLQSDSPSGRDSWGLNQSCGSILLDFLATDIAETLTLRLHYLFCCIPLPEFIVNRSYSYSNETRNDYNSVGASTPFLHRLRRESERVQAALVSEVLSLHETGTRAEAMMQLVLVAEHLARLRSHHALMMVASALQSQAIFRLKASWAVVEQAIPGRWDRLQDIIGLGGCKLVQGLVDRLGRNDVAVGPDVRDGLALAVPPRYRATVLGDGYVRGIQTLLAAKGTQTCTYNYGEDQGCSRGAGSSGGDGSGSGRVGGLRTVGASMTGLPQGCPQHAACLPFVNGFITRLIRVNQSDDYVVAGPPGILNASKIANTGIIVATLRSCQLTAYTGISSEPRILQLLLKPVAYVTENDQWVRSTMLEPKGKGK